MPRTIGGLGIPDTLGADEQVLRWSKQLSDVLKTEGRKAYWRLIRELCLKSEWFLIRVVLQWSWLDEELHGNHLLGFYNRNVGKDTAVFLPRGHGKTLMNGARIIKKILNNPNISLMYSSATEDLAADFCAMVGAELIGNDYLQQAFPDILPKSAQSVDRWGKDGYSIPGRKPRVDPTLFPLSMLGNRTGKHPDEIFADDLIVATNNDPKGWQKAEQFIQESKLLLSPQGVINLTGTRWDDGDTYGKIVDGKLQGRQGRFECMKLSCFIDDDPKKGVIYPEKKRWGVETLSGFSLSSLENMRCPVVEGGLGRFFDAQMRNDPVPEERQDIRVSDINLYDQTAPIFERLSAPRAFGIEVLGGGRPIYQLVESQAESLRFDIPLVEIARKRASVGTTKADRIRSILEPQVRAGRVFALPWMIGEISDSEGLGYEIRRLGAARHDDIVDALTMAIELVADSYPDHDSKLADLILTADLAYTEKTQSDWTVLLALAADSQKNLWVLDYERFQLSQPSMLADRIIQFFRKWSPNEGMSTVRPVRRNFAINY